jgi:copper homeostasis protein (lipoprotein)
MRTVGPAAEKNPEESGMFSIRTGLALLGMSLLYLGCTMKAADDVRLIGVSSMPNPTPAKASLPATYEGVLPCADCPGIKTTLNLWPDGVFYRRMTSADKNSTSGHANDSYDVGRWAMTSDGTRLILQTGGDMPDSFAVKSATRLRLLNPDGKEFDSGRDSDLVRQPRLDMFDPRLTLDGMYTTVSGAGRFKECLTEREFSVSAEAQQRVLESAYARVRLTPSEPLLATIEGRISERRDKNSGGQHVVAVERFVNIWPGETCGWGLSGVELENTDWKLVRLGGRPVSRPTGRQETYVRLVSDGKKLQGFAGCNRVLGGYVLEEKRIRVIDLATTRMSCDDIMEEEKEFLNALSLAVTWKIHGNHLELYGPDGKVQGRFESKPPIRP